MTIGARLRGFRRQEEGGAAIIAALSGLVIIGVGAFGIDLGSFYYQQRRLQTANDLAAIAAAGDLAHASAAAVATLGANAYGAATMRKIETGTYVPDPAVAHGLRFTPNGGGAPNAVRVSLTTTTPMIFGRVFGAAGSGNVTLLSQATAATSAYASFSIGTRLVQVNGGLLNALLGSLLGTSISLQAMDYQSLLSTQIDLASFAGALATRASLTGVSYDSLLASNVKVADVFGAMVDAARASPGSNSTAVAALATLANSQVGSSAVMKLSPLLSFGPLGALPVGSSALVGQSVSALNLASATAQLANGSHQVALDLGASIPGLIGVSLKVTIGEMPVGTSMIAMGFTGASVHTAQTRLLLTAKIAGSGSIVAVNLPIYVEIAAATATLSAIACGRPDVSTSSVTLAVKPAVASAWVGTVSDAEMVNFTSEPSVSPATLVTLPLASVTGSAYTSMTNLAPTPVTFSYADIQTATAKTTSTTDYLATLLGNLIGSLSIKVDVIGLGIGLPLGLQSTVAGIVESAASPVDQLLATTLSTLGIGLGQADTWVTGLRCDGAVLVN